MTFKEIIEDFKKSDPYFRDIDFVKLSREVATQHKETLIGVGYKDVAVFCSDLFNNILNKWESQPAETISREDYIMLQIDEIEEMGYVEIPKVLRNLVDLKR